MLLLLLITGAAALCVSPPPPIVTQLQSGDSQCTFGGIQVHSNKQSAVACGAPPITLDGDGQCAILTVGESNATICSGSFTGLSLDYYGPVNDTFFTEGAHLDFCAQYPLATFAALSTADERFNLSEPVFAQPTSNVSNSLLLYSCILQIWVQLQERVVGPTGPAPTVTDLGNGCMLIQGEGSATVCDGIQGPKGDKGDKGDQGNQGVAGPLVQITTMSPNCMKLTGDGTGYLCNGTSVTLVNVNVNGTAYIGPDNDLLSTAALQNGELVIGVSNSAPVAGSITGTANQVVVTKGPGTIALATPQDIADTSSPTFAGLTLSGLAVYGALIANNKALEAITLTNGQVLIGATGGVPQAGAITGTTNQITVTNGANTIGLSLPQNIHTGASPTFAGLTVTALSASGVVVVGGAGNSLSTINLSANGRLLIGQLGGLPVSAGLTGTTNQVVVTNGPGSISLSLPQDIASSSSPSFTGLTLSGLAANSIISTTLGKALTTTTLTNGQVLIGSTGNPPVAATLTGTTNQITFTSGAGSITAALPQNIHTGATPTFASETLSASSNQLVLGTTQTTTISATAPSSSTTITLPDPGASAASFILSRSANPTGQTISGTVSLTGAVFQPSLTANGVLTVNGTNAVTSTTLTNGQLLIGSTGAAPVAATITGTTNQVNVATGAGSITLSTPQDIATASSPSFTGLTVSGLTASGVVTTTSGKALASTALTNGQVLIGSTGSTAVAATITGTSNQVNVANGAGTITLSTPQDIAAASSPTFAGATISGLTAKSLVTASSSSALSSLSLTNGQIAIGSTGNLPVAATITGTANQVNVANGAGTITLSAPQNIDSTATPTFASQTLTATSSQLTMGPTGNQTIFGSLTTALSAGQVTTMFATPIQLIPAPGANKAIIIETAYLCWTPDGSTAMTGPAGNIVIQYGASAGGTSATNSAAVAQAALITGSATISQWVSDVGINSIVAQAATNMRNAGIYITNLSGAFGDAGVTSKAQLTISLAYMVVPMP